MFWKEQTWPHSPWYSEELIMGVSILMGTVALTAPFLQGPTGAVDPC